MNWIKSLLPITAVVFSAQYGLADTTCLRLTDIDGHTSFLIADETLLLSKEGDEFHIVSSNCDIRLGASRLKEFGYDKRGMGGIEGIEDLQTPATYYRLEGRELKISKSMQGISTCLVYDMKGSLISSIKYSEETVIDFTGYPQGVYLIKIDEAPAFKFVVR